VRHDVLPVVAGDAERLRQLFENLLSNALKYHRPGNPPRVRVTAKQETARWLFAVEDNGRGFPQEYAGKVFGMFKRLHGDIPGTGIGLAICKAVVEAHGGSIWAEAEPDRGATFYFTLPAEVGEEAAARSDEEAMASEAE
jgi:signal transduction histidine kinase